MAIDNSYIPGWTVLVLSEQNLDGIIADNYNTDTSIGSNGAIEARKRQLTSQELERYSKVEYEEIARVYTGSQGITTKHQIVDPSGKIWSVINENNPHDLGIFYQIDVIRRDEEREEET